MNPNAEPHACLNCGAPLAGSFCAACGQRALDPAAPTWHVFREIAADAWDIDGRVARTVRSLAIPGFLTTAYVRGRRASYVGPLKLFFLVGAALSTTWLLTRRIDAAFYGYRPDSSAGTYIETVVHGLLAASAVFALGAWALALGRRRFLDEIVFALHTVAALAILSTIVIWLAAGLKLLWGTQARMPQSVPSLMYLLFLPATALGLIYVTMAIRKFHGGAWWAVVLKTMILVVVGTAVVQQSLSFARRLM